MKILSQGHIEKIEKKRHHTSSIIDRSREAPVILNTDFYVSNLDFLRSLGSTEYSYASRIAWNSKLGELFHFHHQFIVAHKITNHFIKITEKSFGNNASLEKIFKIHFNNIKYFLICNMARKISGIIVMLDMVFTRKSDIHSFGSSTTLELQVVFFKFMQK